MNLHLLYLTYESKYFYHQGIILILILEFLKMTNQTRKQKFLELMSDSL